MNDIYTGLIPLKFKFNLILICNSIPLFENSNKDLPISSGCQKKKIIETFRQISLLKYLK